MVSLTVYPRARPQTRGECAGMSRPCPWLSCRYHLAHGLLGISVPLTQSQAEDLLRQHVSLTAAADAAGISRQRFTRIVRGQLHTDADADIAETLCSMKHTCTLDIADDASERPWSLHDIAAALGGKVTEADLDSALCAMREGLMEFRDHDPKGAPQYVIDWMGDGET